MELKLEQIFNLKEANDLCIEIITGIGKKLAENEITNIKCAIKYYETSGVETKAITEQSRNVNDIVPEKEYGKLKKEQFRVIQYE